jgi:pyridoxamine 5'-phosphate oxidase
VFYTNYESRKGRALLANPRAAMCFHWQPLERQVRVEGPVARVSAEESEAYFASRARGSQIGAWASAQSGVLDSRATLDRRVDEARARFESGAVARPPFWSGYRVKPESIEFWTRDPARLHHRERYDRNGSCWTRTLLYP